MYINDRHSEIQVPLTKDIQAYSIPLGKKLFISRQDMRILRTCSNILEEAVLYTFLSAEKYPFIASDIEINGKLNAIILSGMFVILLWKHFSVIILDNKSNKIHENIPSSKLKIMHSFTAFWAPFSFFLAFSSEAILVTAKLIPEEARVIANVYTDIISWKIPTPSAPILFEIYTLNIIPILCISIAVAVKIVTFIIKSLAFLKLSPYYKKYMFFSKKDE